MAASATWTIRERGRHDVRVAWSQVATIIGVLTAAVGLQSYWIGQALDRIHATLERLDARLSHVEGVILRDHAERIARLEARFD